MSYLIVAQDGVIRHIRQPPTMADVTMAVRGSARPVDCGRLLAWVTEQPPPAAAANVAGSILLWSLGAPTVPYAGPLAVTGAYYTRAGGYRPFPLPIHEAAKVVEVAEAIRRTLAGDALGLWNLDTDQAVRMVGQAVQADYWERQDVVFAFRHGLGPLGLTQVRARLHAAIGQIEGPR